MTKDEELALDLALEALEGIHPGNMTPMAEEYWNKAITAIKQARSAPVQEPVQEPVAWMYEDMMGLVGVRVQKEKPIVARPITPLCLCNPPAAQQEHEPENEPFVSLASVQDQSMFDCGVQPRPLSHPLRAYHIAMSEGPLHYEWTDKPHRLVYDLIAAVRFYANRAAQRQWVGLTDEEIHELWYMVKGEAEPFARAIEAKLKEKNT